MDIEFVDDDSAARASGASRRGTPIGAGHIDGGSDLDEQLPGGAPARRVPRWLVGAGGLAAAAVAIGVVVTQHPAPPAAAALSSSPPPTLAAPTPRVTFEPLPPVVDGRPTDPVLLSVYEQLGGGPSRDLVRGSTDAAPCAPVLPGDVPRVATVTAVRQALPGFRLRDYTRVLDQYAGQCAATLRGSAGGRRVLVSVAAPPRTGLRSRRTLITSASVPLPGGRVTAVEFTTATGWHVVVGASGPRGTTDTAPLARIATDPRVLWGRAYR